MSPIELIALLALTGWAIYKQTVITEVTASGRFKMAIIYAAVGLAVGGFALPHTPAATALLLGGFALSAVIGLARGHYTKIWITEDGKTMRKGAALTIALFLALVATKFALGTLAYFLHINDGAGFGENLFMIAIMIAVQAQIVWSRAQTPRTDAQHLAHSL
ncbi:DUF1453 domain-containing protein [Nakamurella sp. YIM 132087]|uniref:DUF1453 domain-containing protein n=1 Tax=Nakamurella alba TaxID=2665158 RepID=A0A7K1FSQ2_9ACTN|nr:DUF1453 domain-containing protein [Nakamurella alba]MTD17148.1 DUF1453 domain-containing protein [Nakamurella alba]